MINIASNEASIAADDQGQSTALTPFKPVNFDYSILQEPIAAKLRKTVVEINAQLEGAADASFMIGSHLNNVKDDLPHGQFELWLGTQFDMSIRSARNFMARARFIEDLPKDKSATIAELPASALYLLSGPSTPPNVIDEVFARTKAGERLRVTDIAQIISLAKAPAQNGVSLQAAPSPPVEEGIALDESSDTTIADLQDVIGGKIKEVPSELMAADTASNSSDVVAKLSEMIAPTAQQRTNFPVCADRWDPAIVSLQSLVRATGDYSMVSMLSDLVKDQAGYQTVVYLLRNFSKYQKLNSTQATAGAPEEKFAA